MRIAFVLVAALFCASCTSAPNASHAFGESTVRYETEIKCVASNVAPSGCKSEYGIAVVTPVNTGSRLPSVEDLRAPGAGASEF